jgi:hypothetical protein
MCDIKVESATQLQNFLQLVVPSFDELLGSNLVTLVRESFKKHKSNSDIPALILMSY